MEIINRPDAAQWQSLMCRAVDYDGSLRDTMWGIIEKVASEGDAALREYALRFDRAELEQLRVSEAEFAEAESLVDASLKSAIALAIKNIEAFHSAQRMQPVVVETMPGVRCEQRAVAIDSVGLYVPGGNSPLFSTVLMLAVPARIAGCRNIVMCTPPSSDGKVHPAILYAAAQAGVTGVYKVGGAQAVAAMAFGTESVPKVDKIFGPGNRFVMEAKMLVSERGVAIDMPAGPSEVMVIADSEARADYVASDFLSQAEHGPDSQSILLTTDAAVAERAAAETERLLATMPRREMMEKSLSHSRMIVLADDDEVMRFANEYAPEHLIINTANASALAEQVRNAGSVFVGQYSPESVGDYASGTNHTLPTSGFAKSYSGVNLDSFCKKITFQTLTASGVRLIGEAVSRMAAAEDLMAHRKAVEIRME